MLGYTFYVGWRQYYLRVWYVIFMVFCVWVNLLFGLGVTFLLQNKYYLCVVKGVYLAL